MRRDATRRDGRAGLDTKRSGIEAAERSRGERGGEGTEKRRRREIER